MIGCENKPSLPSSRISPASDTGIQNLPTHPQYPTLPRSHAERGVDPHGFPCPSCSPVCLLISRKHPLHAPFDALGIAGIGEQSDGDLGFQTMSYWSYPVPGTCRWCWSRSTGSRHHEAPTLPDPTGCERHKKLPDGAVTAELHREPIRCFQVRYEAAEIPIPSRTRMLSLLLVGSFKRAAVSCLNTSSPPRPCRNPKL